MTVPPESIAAGKCYLAKTPSDAQLWKVIGIMPDGRVLYEQHTPVAGWGVAIQERTTFAAAVEREVPCDWTPDADEASR